MKKPITILATWLSNRDDDTYGGADGLAQSVKGIDEKLAEPGSSHLLGKA